MYADDTALSYTSKLTTELERNINEDLVYLKEYFVINKWSLNIQKWKTTAFDNIQGCKY